MTAQIDDRYIMGDHGDTTLDDALDRILGRVAIVVLVLDAPLLLSLEVLYLPSNFELPSNLGSIVFPVSAVVAGVSNVALVAGVRAVTRRNLAMGLPVIAWMLGFLICASPGPGGDVMLGSDWRTAVLLLCGSVPPLVYSYFHVNAGAVNRPRVRT
ncbi:hypothetical protein [Nocardia sp. CNY236]|uniref:hypothetical protein n=1 Tax=Nocardia sp. CNY236 TaxID=1169152 RepID=UPI000420D1DC|nr:hypothetical protein [Nocardia sp. CNY236]